MNYNTNRVLESVNVKVDKYVEKNEVECKIEPGGDNTFIYVSEGVPYTLLEKEKKTINKQQHMNVELQYSFVEL